MEAAVGYAESRGWEFIRQGNQVWAILYCPERSREGHRFNVHSTPRNPYSHAEQIRRAVNRCNHREAT